MKPVHSLLIGFISTLLFVSIAYAVHRRPQIVGKDVSEVVIKRDLSVPVADIEVAFPMEITVVSSDRNLLEVRGTKSDLDKLSISVTKEDLRIKQNTVNWRAVKVRKRVRATLYTTDPDRIEVVDLSSASRMTIEPRIMVRRFELEASGASSFVGDVEAYTVALDISGASSVHIKGSAETIDADLSGASDVQYQGLCDVCRLDVSGASTFKGRDLMAELAEGEVSGASDVIIGAKTYGKIEIKGASHVESPKDADRSDKGVSSEIDVSGASSFSGSSFAPHGKVRLSGSSNVKLHAVFGHADISVSGASDLKIYGGCDYFKAKVSGSSECDARSFASRTAEIEVSSSSEAIVNVSDFLKADVASFSSLEHVGEPKQKSFVSNCTDRVRRR